MGDPLAYLAAVVALACGSACSLIYNPSNLPTVNADADIDAKLVADADPSMLSLSHVTPSLLVEGEGSGGGRSGVLVVHGMHLVPGAQVAVALHGGGTAKVTVDNAGAQVSDDGYMIAVPIVVDVDPDLDAGMMVRLDVTVTQPNGGSTIAKTLDVLDEPAGAPVLQIKGLDELTGAAVALPSGVNEFSSVEVTGGVTAANPAMGPVIVRASSSVSITGTSQVNATGRVGGAGGADGGTAGMLGLPATQPTPGMGPGGGQVSGGGGSYGSKGGGNSPATVGDAALKTLDSPNRGSGGAGGIHKIAVGNGGAGGGGGGTIEITAAGTVSLGAVEANGGPGTVGAADDGGGGTGGTILLRSGVSVTATAVTATGGPSSIGAGGDGRIRIDAPTMVPSTSTPAFYRGPSFLADTALITRNERPSIQVRGERLRSFSYFFVNEAQNNMRGPYPALTFSPSGDGELQLAEPLFEGINLLCMQVEGADIADQEPEARNCIKLVYLYVKPPGT